MSMDLDRGNEGLHVIDQPLPEFHQHQKLLQHSSW